MVVEGIWERVQNRCAFKSDSRGSESLWNHAQSKVRTIPHLPYGQENFSCSSDKKVRWFWKNKLDFFEKSWFSLGHGIFKITKALLNRFRRRSRRSRNIEIFRGGEGGRGERGREREGEGGKEREGGEARGGGKEEHVKISKREYFDIPVRIFSIYLRKISIYLHRTFRYTCMEYFNIKW